MDAGSQTYHNNKFPRVISQVSFVFHADLVRSANNGKFRPFCVPLELLPSYLPSYLRRPMVHDNRYVRRPESKLLHPVVNGAERPQNQERSIGAMLPQEGEKGDKLYCISKSAQCIRGQDSQGICTGLPQTHFISQDPIQTNLIQTSQPSQALQLIISHHPSLD